MKDNIVQVNEPVLRATAKPVAKKDIASTKIARVIKRMSTLLKNEGFGVAIAAPQVGESLRIFVISGKVFAEGVPDKVFINPELIRISKKKKEMTEGCLSVRNKYGSVMRHEKASITALNEKGKSFVYHGSGLLGQIFQHEIDHLDGILYTDKAVLLTDDEDWKELREKRKKTHE